MKIHTKPITAEDRIDQSRDMSGFNKWAQSSRTVSFIMFLLGWFTIPAEVFLRRDFGQRWFTATNYYAGFLLMLIFATLQYVLVIVWAGISDFIARVATAINPFYEAEDPSVVDQVMDKSMLIFLGIYAVMGAYHRFKIWWRSRTETALHSFDDGTSRLEPLAAVPIILLNILALPLVFLSMLLIPPRQRKGKKMPKLINDRAAFTNTVFEPLLLLVLAFSLHGIASIWLFITTVAVAIHANWKETARLSKVLDFRDSALEAKMMRELHTGNAQNETPALILRQAEQVIQKTPQIASQLSYQFPDLTQIIEEMSIEKRRVATDVA